MPRILRILNRFNLGGPTYNAACLAKFLAPEFETLLIGGVKDESEESSEFIIRDLGINPLIIPEMKRSLDPVRDYKSYRIIKRIIHDFKPDIVHTHASKAGTLGRLAAYAMKVPVIVHTFHGHVFHSYFGTAQTLFYKKIERYLAGKSSCIIAISNKQKEELGSIHRICDEKKIHVIPLGFDLTRFGEKRTEKRKLFRQRYHVNEGELVIVIVGRLVPVKNHELFLQAIHFLKTHCPEKIRAFIVGDGESRTGLERMAGSMGLDFSSPGGPLTFTSWIKNIDEVYAGADIVCLTSRNEGTPVSLIEAQASGKPVVSTRTGGIEDVVIHGVTGFLSGLSHPEEYFNNLITLVKNTSLRETMGKAGADNVSGKYSYQRLALDTKNLYRELLKGKF